MNAKHCMIHPLSARIADKSDHASNFSRSSEFAEGPVADSVRALFHQHGVEFGKYGRQFGLIGEAVQPGNEAIEPWRQEN
ncbi:hypothetical protein [Bradyrhizobium sp. STM 3557]|uniref:hypothetical protein n=1 Tax=Bradyrhizobium sp. STM 3557 TaxID=578920 RepID=UPI00388E9FA0